MLAAEGLRTGFPTRAGTVRAVNDVSFRVGQGELVGLVGESGSGKSTVMLSIMGLVPAPGRVTGGRVLFRGRDLLSLPVRRRRRLRGRHLAMVFQDPAATLNPVFRVGEQIGESLRIHGLAGPRGTLRPLSRRAAVAERHRVLELMEEVGIPSPGERYVQYPHQFSGGMQQRALLAIALAARPQLLLADEPTSALDVTVQAQILDLLRRVSRERGMAVLLVTHDLGVAAEFCDRILVMYAGRLVEEGPTDDVVRRPVHPYTQGLLQSIPRIDPEHRIRPVPGSVPDLIDLPHRCFFYPRCPLASAACEADEVAMRAAGSQHAYRCILPPERARTAWSGDAAGAQGGEPP